MADRTSWVIMAAGFGTAVVIILAATLTPLGEWMVNP